MKKHTTDTTPEETTTPKKLLKIRMEVERREDHKTRDQHGAHHPHSKDDGDRRQNRNEHIIPRDVHSRGSGEILIKGHCKNLIVTDQKQPQNHDA